MGRSEVARSRCKPPAEIVHQGAELLAAEGPLLTVVDGTEVITAQQMHLRDDQLHPTPEGCRVMAERLAPRMAEALAESCLTPSVAP